MSDTQRWYIVKNQDDTCQIVMVSDAAVPEGKEIWGPMVSQGEAIARRVGLIRAGKCQPQ